MPVSHQAPAIAAKEGSADPSGRSSGAPGARSVSSTAAGSVPGAVVPADQAQAGPQAGGHSGADSGPKGGGGSGQSGLRQRRVQGGGATAVAAVQGGTGVHTSTSGQGTGQVRGEAAAVPQPHPVTAKPKVAPSAPAASSAPPTKPRPAPAAALAPGLLAKEAARLKGVGKGALVGQGQGLGGDEDEEDEDASSTSSSSSESEDEQAAYFALMGPTAVPLVPHGKGKGKGHAKAAASAGKGQPAGQRTAEDAEQQEAVKQAQQPEGTAEPEPGSKEEGEEEEEDAADVLARAPLFTRLTSSPEVGLARIWVRARTRPLRRLLRPAWRAITSPSPLAVAWTSIALHTLAVAMALYYIHPSRLRAPDGRAGMTVGTLGFLAAMGSAAVGKVQRRLLTVQTPPAKASAASKGTEAAAQPADTAGPATAAAEKKLAGEEAQVAAPAMLTLQERRTLRTLLRPSTRAGLPALWLATAVGTASVWLRAALTLGLPPALAATVVAVSALSLILSAVRLRDAAAGVSGPVEEGGQEGATAAGGGGNGGTDAAEPPGLALLGTRAVPLMGKEEKQMEQKEVQASLPPALTSAPPPPPGRALLNALTTPALGMPGRFRGQGWSATLDRAAGLLCMAAGIARASCKFTIPEPPIDDGRDLMSDGQGGRFARGQEGLDAALLALIKPAHVELLGRCRTWHAQWTVGAMMVLVVALGGLVALQLWPLLGARVKGVAVGMGRGSASPALRTTLLPILLPLLAAALLAAAGLPVSHGAAPELVWQDGAPGPDGGLYGACRWNERRLSLPSPTHASLLLFTACIGLGWSVLHLADGAFLAASGLAGLDTASLAANLPLLPQAATGQLLSCALIACGLPAFLAGAGGVIGPDLVRPMPVAGAAFLLLAAGRHAVSAWDAMDSLGELEEQSQQRGREHQGVGVQGH